MDKILIIAPHPDDFVISCGGYILKYSDRYKFDILLVANKDLLPSDKVRIDEEIAAVNELRGTLGCKVNHIRYPGGVDTQLYKDLNSLIIFIQNLVTNNHYHNIFIPYHEDTHQDHLVVNQAAVAACRYKRNILLYETPSTLRFVPTLYTELNGTQLSNKVKISSFYRSQILGAAGIDKYELTLEDYITSKALSNGALSRTCKYAEGYIPHRLFI